MKRSYLIAVVGLVIIGCKTEKPDLTHIREAITAEETKNILFTLASDEIPQTFKGASSCTKEKGDGASSQACRWRSADITLYIPKGGEDSHAN